MRFLLIGPSGLDDSALGLALYLQGEEQALPALTITENVVGAVSHYDVNGLPDGVLGQRYELTWAVGGQWGVFRWPQQPGSPESIILPIRAVGVVIGDIDVRLYLDGAGVSTAGLTLTAEGDDYRLDGIPAAPDGSVYRVAYRYGGSYASYAYPDLTAAPSAVVPVASSSPIIGPILRMGADIMRDLAGEQVTLRRPSTLRGRRSTFPLLELAAIATGGATSVTLRERSSGPAMLTGKIPKGATLTIGGADYTATADASATLSGTVVVSITPALAAPGAVGDDITHSSIVEWTVLGRVRTRRIGMVPGDIRDQVSMRVAVPLSELERVGTTAPEAGWTVTDGSGRTGQMLGNAKKRGVVALFCG